MSCERAVQSVLVPMEGNHRESPCLPGPVGYGPTFEIRIQGFPLGVLVAQCPPGESASPAKADIYCFSSHTQLKKDKVLMTCFQDALSYTVVKTITDQFLRGVDTRGESEVKAQSFKAALAIDVIAKLTTIDNHPMNRVLGFGTKYLKENFSPWIQQHGGWVSEFYLKVKSSQNSGGTAWKGVFSWGLFFLSEGNPSLKRFSWV